MQEKFVQKAQFIVHVIRDGVDVCQIPTELEIEQGGIAEISYCDGFGTESTGGTFERTGSDNWYQLSYIYGNNGGKFSSWKMDIETGNYNDYRPYFSIEDERKAEAMAGSL